MTFSSREAWARDYIATHPAAHAFEIMGAYNATDLGDTLGYFSLGEIQELQAELGAAGVTRESLAAQRQRGAERAAQREARAARWKAMSPADLAALGDVELVQAVLTRLHDRESTTPILNAIVCAFFLDADVRNGGFDQYFWNKDDAEVDDALTALRAANAHDAVPIVERAAAVYRRKYPDGMRAADVPRERDPEFDDLDTAYYAALKSIMPALAPLVRENLGDA